MDKKGFIIIFHRYFFYAISLILLAGFLSNLGESYDINLNFDALELRGTNPIIEENYTQVYFNKVTDNLTLLNAQYYELACNGTVDRNRFDICTNLYKQISDLTDTYNSIKNGSFVPVKKEESRKEIIVEEKSFIEIKEVSETERQEREFISNKNYYESYMTGGKTIKLRYVLRGETKSINYDVYKGLNDYYADLERSISYSYVAPTDRDFALKKTDNTMQTYFLKQLAEKIKNETSNKDDQARIAISLVQQLPYDWNSFYSIEGGDRYPYEVIYDETGVCGEKTKLTAILLRELGFGTALLTFNSENHEAIGIKCPSTYDYGDSGYCFVETTTPSIITDSKGDYVGAGKLSSNPEIIVISQGNSFESVSEEYNDNIDYQRLIAKGEVLSQSDYNKWQKIVKKYGFRFD